MTKEHFRNIIRLDDKGLTLAHHCYAKVMAKWLKVLADYVRQSNLTLIMSETVLKQLRTLRIGLNLR